MAQLFLNDTFAESCADGTDGFDMTSVQGTGTPTTAVSVNSTTFTEDGTFDETVGTGGQTGDYDISVDISLIDVDTEARWRLQRLNSSCVVQESSGYSTIYNSFGIKTDTISFSPTWAAGDVLRLSLEVRRSLGHGSKSYDIRQNDADSFVTEPAGVITHQGNLSVFHRSNVIGLQSLTIRGNPTIQFIFQKVNKPRLLFDGLASIQHVFQFNGIASIKKMGNSSIFSRFIVNGNAFLIHGGTSNIFNRFSVNGLPRLLVRPQISVPFKFEVSGIPQLTLVSQSNIHNIFQLQGTGSTVQRALASIFNDLQLTGKPSLTTSALASLQNKFLLAGIPSLTISDSASIFNITQLNGNPTLILGGQSNIQYSFDVNGNLSVIIVVVPRPPFSYTIFESFIEGI